ncbi:RNA-binding domain-containing protein [Lentithecium fluviatile CBS 122367]|uniref:RNA-binding domain-containing protein n=1 Tax=Lentithecium fluviatile CBS 122367 TaxID=1168545 RepID=A0A6G1J7N1_9PLEO|nr:RNA-binding domain-containing protein [Lentithecium fluviatile CBS 122367]
MSKLKALEPQSEAYKLIKDSRRLKKESNDKKKTKTSSEIVAQDGDGQDDVKTPKKRKREELPSEIEIDISAPEPASKKAARKAKKAKITPTSDGTVTAAEGTQNDQPPNVDTASTSHAGKRSDHGVWIGNLPWTATTATLHTFLTSNTSILPAEITRIHMPAPKAAPRPDWRGSKPQNRGFAYVDFSTELAMYSAIALTETQMDGRALLIKNARNFEGRPDRPKAEQDETLYGGKRKGEGNKSAKAPSKKVFVGNLAFETSREDLMEHFGQCGVVEDIHMATFEDSGKSKGYAWVTFEDVEAATSAVNGYVYKTVIDEGKKKTKGDDSDDDDEAKGKSKKRKWKLNKLMGRELRCEFAEDSTTRYQKRFGKEAEEGSGFAGDDGNVHPQRKSRPFAPGGKPAGKPFKPRGKVDPRTIRPGAAHANAPRSSAAIVESKGKKTTFD